MVRAIDVSDLPEPLIDAIESMVSTYRQRINAAAGPPGSERPFGWLKGQWEVPDTFLDPLPDDVLEDFEGGGRE